MRGRRRRARDERGHSGRRRVLGVGTRPARLAARGGAPDHGLAGVVASWRPRAPWNEGRRRSAASRPWTRVAPFPGRGRLAGKAGGREHHLTATGFVGDGPGPWGGEFRRGMRPESCRQGPSAGGGRCGSHGRVVCGRGRDPTLRASSQR